MQWSSASSSSIPTINAFSATGLGAWIYSWVMVLRQWLHALGTRMSQDIFVLKRPECPQATTEEETTTCNLRQAEACEQEKLPIAGSVGAHQLDSNDPTGSTMECETSYKGPTSQYTFNEKAGVSVSLMRHQACSQIYTPQFPTAKTPSQQIYLSQAAKAAEAGQVEPEKSFRALKNIIEESMPLDGLSFVLGNLNTEDGRHLASVLTHISPWVSPVGLTLFHLAVKVQNHEALRLLVGALVSNSHKVGINVTEILSSPGDTLQKRTPLHMACMNNDVISVQILVRASADLNAKTRGGSTPLHTAALKGFYRICEILLENGCEVDAQTTTGGATALISATANEHYDIVRLLLQHDADPGIADKNGRTSRSIARQLGFTVADEE